MTPWLFTLLLGLCFSLQAQGPISGFMPQTGQVDIAYTYSQEQFDQFYDEQGDRVPRSLSSRSHNLFLEYGMNARSSLVLTAPYIDNGAGNRAWQDGSLWLKYRNQRREKPPGFHNLITAVGLSFPLSKYANDNPAAIGRRATTFNGRLGWQYEARYGWFFQLQSGIDFQFAPLAQSAIPLLLRGGIGTSWVYADLWLEHYQSLNGSPADGQLAAGTGSTWTRLGGTLYFPIRPWMGWVGGITQVLGGRNIGASTVGIPAWLFAYKRRARLLISE